MKKKMWKFIDDFEKEEVWLNEMSSNGLALINRFLREYEFTDCNPGEYIYRIEYLKKRPGSRESQKYLSFMIDSRVEYVCSQGNLVYFRRKADEGPFEVYTDIDSKLSYYKRVSNYWLFSICMSTLFIVTYACIGIHNYLLTKELEQLYPDLEIDPSLLLWPLSSMGIFIICILVMLAIAVGPWNNYRKKVKRLKEEKNTRV